MKALWKQKTTIPRGMMLTIPHYFQKACEEYFQWCEDNPVYEMKFVFSEEKSLTKPRVFTIGGLCIFIGISKSEWDRKRNGDDEDFKQVIDWAEEVIRNQKYTGAAVNLFNSMLIMRDLGITDKIENKNINISPTVIEDDIPESKSD